MEKVRSLGMSPGEYLPCVPFLLEEEGSVDGPRHYSSNLHLKVYDSLFQYLDRESIQLVETLFWCDGIDPQIKMIQCRKQIGAKDCGIYLQLLLPLQLPMD